MDTENGQASDSNSEFGSLGSDSDLQAGKPIQPQSGRWRMLVALLAGAVLAVPFVATGTARAAWTEISQFLTLQGKPKPASPAILSEHEVEHLDSEDPQAQAQLLLERAINHYQGASDQIATRVDSWRGKLKRTPQLESLITTALNANDLRVRAAAIEVDLAALGQAKTPDSVERLIQQAESGEQSQRIWALWTMGLLGNRGVAPDRVSQFLITQLHDPNQDVRYWVVEGLAYLGTNDTIEPLLQTFHDDPSPTVRERAACGLAQSGMLSQEQRLTLVPRLLDFADDASLDAQTHTWVYQALRDITAQNLPNDPAAWRNWYNSTGGH
ncbi:MAG: HEAT repeat domain-containing protein [Acidobacteriia bacterium]|nr:HEAT repeat domain-containing protein [Terriglobia bacterium]